MDGEMKEKRKIQFSVPSAMPTQLDPKQVEMIRRRRPTPATLFRMTDHPSPEEENPGHQLAICDNGLLMGKRANTAIYQPPSLTAVQKMVEAHMQSSETGRDSPSSELSDNEEASQDSDTEEPRSEEHRPGQEDPAEERGSVLQGVPGEDPEGELEGGIHRVAEPEGKGDDLSGDLTADQSEVSIRGVAPTVLDDPPWRSHTGDAEPEGGGGVEQSTERRDEGKVTEKGDD